MTEQEQKQIIALNEPLLDQQIVEERTYAQETILLSTVGILGAFLLGNIFAAALFFCSCFTVLILRRINCLAIDTQMQINIEVTTHVSNSTDNVWQKIVSVGQWVSVGFLFLGALATIAIRI